MVVFKRCGFKGSFVYHEESKLERYICSNRWPQPWQGCALPTELVSHKLPFIFSAKKQQINV